MSVPLPYLDVPLDDQDILTLLTMALWGEARGEFRDGIVAVGCVIRNRVLQAPRWGDSWRAVILQPKQFSCMNADDPNSKKILRPLEYGSPATWRDCGEIAEALFHGDQPDITGGSCWYHTIKRPRGVRTWPPKWTNKLSRRCTIGSHIFYGEPR